MQLANFEFQELLEGARELLALADIMDQQVASKEPPDHTAHSVT
jgi:hypothetical protein